MAAAAPRLLPKTLRRATRVSSLLTLGPKLGNPPLAGGRPAARGEWLCCRAASFDHLVGEREQIRRNLKAERFRGLEIDDQRVFRRLLHGEVGWTGAPEDAVNVGCRLRVQAD